MQYNYNLEKIFCNGVSYSGYKYLVDIIKSEYWTISLYCKANNLNYNKIYGEIYDVVSVSREELDYYKLPHKIADLIVELKTSSCL